MKKPNEKTSKIISLCTGIILAIILLIASIKGLMSGNYLESALQFSIVSYFTYLVVPNVIKIYVNWKSS